jgi:hypothetical protein
MSDDTTRREVLVATGAVGAVLVAGCTDTGASDDDSMDDGNMDGDEMATEFTVRIENVSSTETLETSEGSFAVPLSPTAYAVHEQEGVLFEADAEASDGLERLAEDGSPDGLVSELEMTDATVDAAAIPVDAEEPGPIGPGGAYEFTVEATEGQRLSLATMFVQSNDLFYAPEPAGIPLYEMGEPIDGDVTDRLVLWDAGTEENEEPGVGGNQAPRQMEAGSGPTEGGTVREIGNVDDGYDYPDTADVIRVTVSTGGMET